jgi:hypothetical protein
MYSWEDSFLAQLRAIRREEMHHIAVAAYIVAVAWGLLLHSVPILLPMLVFSAYSELGGSLDASTVFPVVALFNLTRVPLAWAPMGFVQVW